MDTAQPAPTGIHKPTVILAACMIVLGVIAYIATGMVSVTALIPSFIGVPILICGVLASKMRKPALISAMVLAVLGFLGPLGRIIPTAIKGELSFGPAIVSQFVFMALAAALVAVIIFGPKSRETQG